ncbi:hypothetical protein XELAEV_18045739mg [Xenopus laevis]|uniref:G-protein coupled receptors family 1 profile domain-containing protein n=1 Tax=Xenopus laevis TaxID=8355 RepID=A0A974H4Y3_XENLA|nr:hypothetical protein XELAEV_18045739mg [Xenopus laevis]
MLGLTGLPDLQLALFLVFLMIYFITLNVNFLIILIIFTDSHLHSPMYFFLGTLACLDMGCSSAIVPRMLFDLLTGRKLISVQACITQFYFFFFFIASGYCSGSDLLQISCSDTSINILLIFVSVILYGVVILGVTFYPYITILRTVLKIPSKNMRSKAFSTCSSHLTVVFLFYITASFNYLYPNTNYNFIEGKVASVFYFTLTPFLNPLIYSLRNQEFITSLRKTLHRQLWGRVDNIL